jgi:octaprenyl-diphosphate synthase
MLRLDDIKKPISREMDEFEGWFRNSMKSSVPLLDKITHYIVKRKGKQMRPMFVFLSAGMFGPIKDSAFHAASLIELLHTATLVQDDSSLRRGFFSVNALWRNKIAVLVGDYLLSKGLLLSVENKEFNLLGIVSEAVRMMSEGELLQIEKARKLDIVETVYFEIIRKKTASLIASCCACGASSSGADNEETERMRLAGEKIGMAFQIKDDLFDFDFRKNTGKPSGSDIKEKKITLPLIHVLEKSESKQRREIMATLKNHSHDRDRVRKLMQMVENEGGIEYAHKMMHQYRQEAFEIINSFPGSVYRNSLCELVTFTTERDK